MSGKKYKIIGSRLVDIHLEGLKNKKIEQLDENTLQQRTPIHFDRTNQQRFAEINLSKAKETTVLRTSKHGKNNHLSANSSSGSRFVRDSSTSVRRSVSPSSQCSDDFEDHLFLPPKQPSKQVTSIQKRSGGTSIGSKASPRRLSKCRNLKEYLRATEDTISRMTGGKPNGIAIKVVKCPCLCRSPGAPTHSPMSIMTGSNSEYQASKKSTDKPVFFGPYPQNTENRPPLPIIQRCRSPDLFQLLRPDGPSSMQRMPIGRKQDYIIVHKKDKNQEQGSNLMATDKSQNCFRRVLEAGYENIRSEKALNTKNLKISNASIFRSKNRTTKAFN